MRRWAALLRAWLTVVWVSVLLLVGGVVAPVLFVTLDRPLAGRIAGQFFALEAYFSLGLAVVLLVLNRYLSPIPGDEGAQADDVAQAVTSHRNLSGSIDLPAWGLLCWALGCTIVGQYVVAPEMAAARTGHSAWTFDSLHAWASAIFGVKLLAVGALSWRWLAVLAPVKHCVS